MIWTRVTSPPGRHRGTGTLALAASRLTGRDLRLIRLLWEHRVFTVHQITDLAFGSATRARHRMLDLARIHAVVRFRPVLPAGSSPTHYLIGPAGARVIAAEHGLTLAELGYRPDRTEALIYAPTLGHLLGINGIFAALTAVSRRMSDAQLVTWWSEQRCAGKWGTYIRPDAYGRWSEAGRAADFFVEYDTGTEPLGKVAAKFRGYGELATTSGLATPVLIWTSGPARETHLLARLAHAPVPVFTTSSRALESRDPSGPRWMSAHRPGVRHRLIELPSWDDLTTPEARR